MYELVKTYIVGHGNKTIEVKAWSRKNARLSGSRKLGTTPAKVYVKQKAPLKGPVVDIRVQSSPSSPS